MVQLLDPLLGGINVRSHHTRQGISVGAVWLLGSRVLPAAFPLGWLMVNLCTALIGHAREIFLGCFWVPNLDGTPDDRPKPVWLETWDERVMNWVIAVLTTDIFIILQ